MEKWGQDYWEQRLNEEGTWSQFPRLCRRRLELTESWGLVSGGGGSTAEGGSRVCVVREEGHEGEESDRMTVATTGGTTQREETVQWV